jgi:sensor histidine kinase YesM
MLLDLLRELFTKWKERMARRRKPGLKLYIMGFSSLFIAIIFISLIVYGYVNTNGDDNDRVLYYYLSSGVMLGVSIAAFVIFHRKIYQPIERANFIISELVAGNTEAATSEVSKRRVPYPIFDDLNAMTQKLQDLLYREYTANMLKKQAELDALQSQINPHFLYNTLESIRGLAIACNAREIQVMTKALADLFRYSISVKGNMVELREEIKNVENYLTIQQYRFNNKFIIQNKIDEDTLDNIVPKLLMQPLVENAIIHGLETKMGKGTITLMGYKTQNRLIINIRDDGVGLENAEVIRINTALVNGEECIKTDSRSKRSIGIANVNQRIRMLFGEEYGVRLYSTKGYGTNVEVQCPLVPDIRDI